MTASLDPMLSRCLKAERERDAALKLAESNGKLAHDTAIELREAREQRDALAEACRWAQTQLGKHTRPSPIDKALATLKP